MPALIPTQPEIDAARQRFLAGGRAIRTLRDEAIRKQLTGRGKSKNSTKPIRR